MVPMSIYAVWLDHDHAKILNFTPQELRHEKVDRSSHGHHTGNHEQEKKNQIQKFYHELLNHLQSANQILVMGPGQAKTEFVKHMEDHHHKNLLAKVIGVEAIDYVTDGEIEKKAREIFTKHNLFS